METESHRPFTVPIAWVALVAVFAIMRLMRRRQGDDKAGENSLKELASW